MIPHPTNPPLLLCFILYYQLAKRTFSLYIYLSFFVIKLLFSGIAPHKVLQNTSLAVGISPFGEKIILTTKPTSPSPSLPLSSSHSPSVTLDIHCQEPTSLPLLHQASLNRFMQFLHNPPDPLPPSHSNPNKERGFPFLDILGSQAKLRGLQKKLHDLTDELTFVWQGMHRNEKGKLKESTVDKKVDGKDRKSKQQEIEEGDEEEVAIQPKKWEEDMKRLQGIIAKCMKVYEESRKMLGAEFVW